MASPLVFALLILPLAASAAADDEAFAEAFAVHGQLTYIEQETSGFNAPYRGGTHLPDITVIMPVFPDGDAGPAWYVAARGHHADIGGIAPGSMPPDSRTIADEGVLIDNQLMVDEGRFREAEMCELLGRGEWPARNPDRNISDLKAQLAACTRGPGARSPNR